MDVIAGLQRYSGQPITKQLLMDLLRDYRRPYDKINELVKQDYLVPIKRGIFITGSRLRIPAPENMFLANHLWGPSYVSSDSALSYWRLIPERVYETISMTTNPAKTYKTPLGRFRYVRLPLPYYSLGIQRIELAPRQMTLIAGKEKSLCDKIVTTHGLTLRSEKHVRSYFQDDLRISRESLRELNTQSIADYLNSAPKHESLSIVLKTLNKL